MLYQKAFEQYYKLGKGGSQVFKAHLAPYKAIQEEIVEFLTDKMEDPYF
jgi:hypothetical protein